MGACARVCGRAAYLSLLLLLAVSSVPSARPCGYSALSRSLGVTRCGLGRGGPDRHGYGPPLAQAALVKCLRGGGASHEEEGMLLDGEVEDDGSFHPVSSANALDAASVLVNWDEDK